LIKKINKSITIFLFISVFLGIVFRLYNLNFENQWNDEIFTFWATDPKITFSETFSRVNQFESIPVLYFLLIKSLHALFGYSPDIGRYFSALFGILSIFTIGYLAKQISNNKSYLFVIYLISLNIFLISYSQESRVYIFSFFLTSIYLIFFFKIHKNQKKKIFDLNFIFFNIFQILTFLSFPFTIIVFLSILTFTFYEYIFFKKKNFQILVSLFISLTFLIIYLPYYLKTVPLAVNWLTQPDLKFYTDYYFTKFFGSRIMGLIHLIIFITLIIKFHKKIFYENNYYLFFILNIFLIYFIPIFYGLISQPAIHERYIMFVIIPITILLSCLIFEIQSQKLKKLLIIFFIVITFANHFTESTLKQFFKHREIYKPNFVETYKYINKSEFKNIYFDLNNFKKENRERIFNVYKNYSNYLLNLNSLEIKVFSNIDDNIDLDGFWSICLFGTIGCEYYNPKYKIVETKKFPKLLIKLYKKI